MRKGRKGWRVKNGGGRHGGMKRGKEVRREGGRETGRSRVTS